MFVEGWRVVGGAAGRAGGGFSGGVEVGGRGSGGLYGALGGGFGSRGGSFGPDSGDSDAFGPVATDIRTAGRPAGSLLFVFLPPISGREAIAQAWA